MEMMSTKKRILCIVQLCLGLITFLWIILFPFLGSIYHYKSQLFLYESIFGQTDLFELLPKSDQKVLKAKYEKIKALSAKPKLLEALSFFSAISPYEMTWVIFAIVLPIFLLLRIEGVNQLVWILPLLCLLFSYENRKFGKEVFYEKIPNETYIMDNYIKEPLGSTIKEEFEQLKQGWTKYLVIEWAKESPSLDSLILEQQIRKGQFLFNVQKVKEAAILPLSHSFLTKRSYLTLMLYIIWNFLFACFARNSLNNKVDQKTCQIA